MSLLCAFHGAIAAAEPAAWTAIFANANCCPATDLSSVTVNNATQTAGAGRLGPSRYQHILLAACTYSGIRQGD